MARTPDSQKLGRHPVAKALKLNPEAKGDRAKISALLKTWTVTGMFVTVEKKMSTGTRKPMSRSANQPIEICGSGGFLGAAVVPQTRLAECGGAPPFLGGAHCRNRRR